MISTFGDESNALILVAFRIGLGPRGAMVTMARACLYSLDENKKTKKSGMNSWSFHNYVVELSDPRGCRKTGVLAESQRAEMTNS